jgi:hypothetical protein
MKSNRVIQWSISQSKKNTTWVIFAISIFLLLNMWSYWVTKIPLSDIIEINVCYFVVVPLVLFLVLLLCIWITDDIPHKFVTAMVPSLAVIMWFCTLTGIRPLDNAKSTLRDTDSSSYTSYSDTSEPSLTGTMDGNAWNSASLGSKQALAADISMRLNDAGASDCSASFIYDALNSFYTSTDQHILDTEISKIVGLSVIAAKSLPESQRNY